MTTDAPEAAATARLVAEFDHWDPELAKDPFPVYDDLRTQCPVAHSDAYGGFFVLTRYEDIEAAARDHADILFSIDLGSRPGRNAKFAAPRSRPAPTHRFSSSTAALLLAWPHTKA